MLPARYMLTSNNEPPKNSCPYLSVNDWNCPYLSVSRPLNARLKPCYTALRASAACASQTSAAPEQPNPARAARGCQPCSLCIRLWLQWPQMAARSLLPSRGCRRPAAPSLAGKG